MRLRIYTYPFVHKLSNKLNKYIGQYLCTGTGKFKTATKIYFFVSNRERQIINSYFTTSIRTILTLLLPQNSIFL